MRGKDYFLFSKNDLSLVFAALRHRMTSAIEEYDGNQLLSTNAEDLVNYFVQTAELEPLALKEGEITADECEIKIDVSRRFDYAINDRSKPFYIPGIAVSLNIPFEGDSDLLLCRPSSYNNPPPMGIVSKGELVLTYESTQQIPEEAKSYFDRQLSDVKQYVFWIDADVRLHNNEIEALARQLINARKEKLLQNRITVAGLGYPLKRRTDAPATYVLPTVRRKVFPSPPPASTASFLPEPALDDSTYDQILAILGNMVRVMEQSPEAFATMKEEDLRTHFLVQLNAQFEGRASAETFRGSGSTDILLIESDRSVFIAECKFWKGPSSLVGAMDQLLDYATWRDGKAAVLIFNRNKDFSSILASISAILDGYANKVGGVTGLSESVWRLKVCQRDDPERLISVTVLAYNVPTERRVSRRLSRGASGLSE